MFKDAGIEFGGAARFVQETGGDYFDFFPLCEPGVGMVIGDASGHGIAECAALVGDIGRVKLSANWMAACGSGPSAAVSRFNTLTTSCASRARVLPVFRE